MAELGPKPSGKMLRKGKFFKKPSSEKLTLNQLKKGGVGGGNSKNHQSQFCKSKNEKASLWIIFTYSKTEIRGTFIFNTEARTCLLLLSSSNVFPGFIWAASMLLQSACIKWVLNAHTLLLSVRFSCDCISFLLLL